MFERACEQSIDLREFAERQQMCAGDSQPVLPDIRKKHLEIKEDGTWTIKADLDFFQQLFAFGRELKFMR